MSEKLERRDSWRKFMNEEKNRYFIFQLIDDEENAEILFMSYEWMREKGEPIVGGNYACRYVDDIKERDGIGDVEILDELYEKFNINRPADYHGRSVSISDIVVLLRGGRARTYYVDSIGFRRIPNIFGGDAK